jgi:hypothetical protein
MGPSTFQGVSDDDLAEKLDKLTEARQNALAAASQEHRANPGNRKSLKLNEEAIRLATEAAGIEEELGRRQAMRGVDEHIIRTAQEAARAELDRENADLVAQWRELTAKNPKDAAAAAGLANALSRAVPGSGLYEQDLNQRVEKMLASVKATIEGGTDAQTKLWADAMREMDEMAKTSRLRARQAGGVDM